MKTKKPAAPHLMINARYTATGETVQGVYTVAEIRVKPIVNTNRGLLSLFGGPWQEVEIFNLARL